MMRALIIILLFPLLTVAQNSRKTARILFLGNSYTHYNNLPALLTSIADAQNDSVVYDQYSPGGYTFQNHYNDPTTKNKIALGNWDYIILQGQSQEPSFSPAQVNAQSFPYVRKLDSLIKISNPCALTVFYETWGRKYGDAGNCAFYPPVCTYQGMQDRLRASYKLFADSARGIVAPVGEAFRASISFSPALELYDPDQSHPALTGSYLAALVFYESIFQRSAVSNTYNPGIAAPSHSFLQTIAHSTVTDSLATWNQGIYHPWAGFVSQASGLLLHFYSNSNLNNTWYFGDGNKSINLNPSHTYSNPGTYTISHVVNDLCKKDSVSLVLVVSGLVNALEHSLEQICIAPNPCQDYLHINMPFGDANSIEITDLNGRQVQRSSFQSLLRTADLKPGVYILTIRSVIKAKHLLFSKID